MDQSQVNKDSTSTIDLEKNVHEGSLTGALGLEKEKAVIVTVTPLSDPVVDESDSDSEDDYKYPEGGLQAWLVVFGSWCGMFCSFGIANSTGSFQAYLASNQLASYSDSQIGWIFSLYSFILFIGGIYIGPAFDVYGPRYLVLPGSILLVLSVFLFGECTEYWHWIAVFSILGGFASSLTFTPSVAVIGHWFNKKRGNATGIAATGGAVGGIVFPLLLENLIPKIGFSWTMRVMGFIFVFITALANLLIKPRLPRSQTAQSPHPDIKIFKKPDFAFTVLGVYLLEWGFFIPVTYITSFALYQGFDAGISYQSLSILSAASVVGRFLPGLVADKIGRFNTIIMALSLTVFACFVVWLPFGNTYAGLICTVIILGFACGSNVGLTPVCVGQLCDTKDYGRYYATCYSVVSIGCLTGVPIAGVLIETCGGAYWGLILFTGLCYASSAVAMACARGYGGGWKLNAKF
ncbi:uncharacterized protein EAF01_008340 [Botrytis porri]|uniref:Major facilitator superfamily (MFS) profile domain-containing protein n=1 Tax=Botrytis porri TaxID=87229 RepID=A0A4Z1K8S9_9HELO|nr:uncharacterized protein EAF01_008340 [Botrytis porri]KAF7899127.1 hypothetical protein EAF01_008340 [Botrytis porri]TGO82060.1 hypothetical protein BPOR_0932g00010 [Botrytis porri]